MIAGLKHALINSLAVEPVIQIALVKLGAELRVIRLQITDNGIPLQNGIPLFKG